MNMNINPNTISFKGYSNLLSGAAEYSDGYVAFISAKLDNKQMYENEKIYNHLDRYKSIQSMMDIPPERTSDILTIGYMKSYGGKERFFINNSGVLWGEELIELERNEVPQKMSRTVYKLNEQLHLKIYDLFANITKKIMYKVNSTYDNNLNNVLLSTLEAFKGITRPEIAQDIVKNGNTSNSHEILAKAFNSGIISSMNKFFKI